MTGPLPAVNLLAWRAQQRQRRCRRFNFMLVGLLLAAVLANAGLGIAVHHQVRTLSANHQQLNHDLEHVTAKRAALSASATSSETLPHWIDSGQWLRALADQAPEVLHWQALQWDRSSGQWRLRVAGEDEVVAQRWAESLGATMEKAVDEITHRGESVPRRVVVGEVDSLLALRPGDDDALVE
jgi:hypothetical protein